MIESKPGLGRREMRKRVGEHMCASTNHEDCAREGDLWQCESCGRWFCWSEGAADKLPDLCDDCYCKRKGLRPYAEEET